MKPWLGALAFALLGAGAASGQCLSNVYSSPYPSGTFTPVCTGSAENITTCAYASEYSNVALTAGVSYTFTSSAGYFITISDASGTTPYAWGVSPVVYMPTTSATYRFYRHSSAACGSMSGCTTVSITCAPPPPPANDVCPGTDLATLTSPISASTSSATDDYAPSCDANTANDVIYYIDVPDGSQLTIGQTVNNYDSQVEVAYGGSCPGATSIACFDDPDIQDVIWMNTTGTTQTVYWLQDGYASSSGTYTLAWSVVACTPPSGTTAQVVDCGTGTFTVEVTVTGTGSGATVDLSSDENGVEYSAVDGSANPYVMGPYPIGISVALTMLHESDSDCDLALGSFYGAGVLCNDDCSGALDLPSCSGGDQVVSGTSTGSTIDAGWADCGSGGTVGQQRGVWYHYAGDDNEVTITTCDPGGVGYDTRLTVYDGSCGVLNCITGNDDMTPACATGSFRSRVVFNAYSGTDYYVFVHGYQSGASPSTTGDFNLHLTCAPLCLPVPTNDDCAAAIGLGVGPICAPVAGTNDCAAASSPNPGCFSPFATLPDVYYWFTAPGTPSGDVVLNITEGTASGIGYALYEVGCGGAEVECNDTYTSGTDVLIDTDPGVTYYVRVLTGELSTGTFDICVREACSSPTATPTLVPDCANDQFYVNVDVTSTGNGATVDLSSDVNGVEYAAVDGSGNPYQMGPYPSGSSVDITVNHENDALCDLDLGSFSYTCPPPNDDCASAIAVSCNSVTLGSTTGATFDADALASCGTTSGAPGVWYTVTGSGGDMTVSLCGSSYDTKLHIYTGSCGGFVCEGGNDDDCGLQSQVTWASTAGTTYTIHVFGYGVATGNFVMEVACAGNIVPPCVDNNVTVEIGTDSYGSETSWEIVPFGLSTPVCTGDGYGDNMSYAEACCLLDGDYVLTFFDGFGDGMCCSYGNGGYRLKAANGDRIIDNWEDGAFGSSSSTGLPFHVPIGSDHVIFQDCDREDWTPSEFIVASPNPAVSAEWGVGDQTDDGYQFWFLNPDGGYNRRIFRNHATSGGYGPPGPTRACHLLLSSMVTFPLPYDVLLNVRVRSRVNGAYSQFGPACRFMLASTPPACPTTMLIDNPNSPNYSCDVDRTFGGSDKVYCYPVSGANKYQFSFRIFAEGFTRNIASSSAGVILNWTNYPLEAPKSYDVLVRASFDNGATYCAFGDSCKVTIVDPPAAQNRDAVLTNGDAGITLFPNPTNGEQVYLTMNDLPEGEVNVSIEVYDMFGKLVMTRNVGAQDGTLNTVLQLDKELASGLYTVNATAAGHTWTQRLVINR
ncbi:MAG: T9SS type A sorting domain-containing protein [Flavobacteriales bacterium]|nr:T9SS type A sorting domain-containing protein [Flavobacteriales bacterium]MCB9167726.1 T9SS type A sorting domain-containing protein [Flavobacteriales bacterium]